MSTPYFQITSPKYEVIGYTKFSSPVSQPGRLHEVFQSRFIYGIRPSPGIRLAAKGVEVTRIPTRNPPPLGGQQPLLGLSMEVIHVLPRPREILQCFLRHIGILDRRQLPGPMEPGQVQAVPSIAPGAITWLLRHRQGATTWQTCPRSRSCRWRLHGRAPLGTTARVERNALKVEYGHSSVHPRRRLLLPRAIRWLPITTK
jgi:hypothetical protein